MANRAIKSVVYWAQRFLRRSTMPSAEYWLKYYNKPEHIMTVKEADADRGYVIEQLEVAIEHIRNTERLKIE